MKKEFIYPDFNNSNLNISATLAEFLNAPNKNATIKELKEELNKNYKNIVFICFDGLGINPINLNLNKEDILFKNIKKQLTSTFPSTTTNATTSLSTNTLPLEHGWFGWSLNFPKENRNVDIYLGTDSVTGESLNIDYPINNPNYYFDNTNTDYNINTIFPSFVKVKHEERNNVFNTNEEFFNKILEICNKKGKQFIYAYNPEPDHTMHEIGVKNDETKKLIKELNKSVENLVNNTKDTLFIITADHGQIDIEGYVEFYKDEKLINMLTCYPYLDARSVAFKVKVNEKENFVKYFNETYSEDFILFKTEDLINKGVFGNVGEYGYLLGDFIAAGTFTNKQALLTPISNKFKGHHTSFTHEMLVPLILINS